MGDTVEEVKDSVEDTVEEVKEGVKKNAEKITDSDTYLGSDDEKENKDNEVGGKDPMNPDDVAKHEPTAVKRDKNQGSSGDPV
jgi:hypothetical protein